MTKPKDILGHAILKEIDNGVIIHYNFDTDKGKEFIKHISESSDVGDYDEEEDRMDNKFYITFDKSQEDIPTLVVFTESYFLTGPAMKVLNVITGDRAVAMWEELQGKVAKNDIQKTE